MAEINSELVTDAKDLQVLRTSIATIEDYATLLHNPNLTQEKPDAMKERQCFFTAPTGHFSKQLPQCRQCSCMI